MLLWNILRFYLAKSDYVLLYGISQFFRVLTANYEKQLIGPVADAEGHPQQIIDELGSSEVGGLSRRDLFRKALAQRLISDFELWIELHEARNSTSLNYDETNSERVYSDALSFAKQARALIRLLERRGWTHEP